MKTLKILSLIAFMTICMSGAAQSVEGKLTLNGKSKTELNLESNSAVQLFKDFKTGKYQLKFDFDGKDLPKNFYKERIVFFEFKTEVFRDDKLVKNVIRKQPIPFFPGDIGISAEVFDFISVLSMVTSWDDMQKNPEVLGIMPEGNYRVRLSVKPLGMKGQVAPVEFTFLRKRPGRAKF